MINESAEKMLLSGFSQIREGLNQVESISRLMGMESTIISISDCEDVFETSLKDVLESIRISLDIEQKRKLPDIP